MDLLIIALVIYSLACAQWTVVAFRAQMNAWPAIPRHLQVVVVLAHFFLMPLGVMAYIYHRRTGKLRSSNAA